MLNAILWSGRNVMGEQAIFLAGAVFLVMLSFTMIRLGRSIGGVAWFQAWLALFGSGLSVSLVDQFPVLTPLVPALGTAFATYLFAGALLFTGRCTRFPRSLMVLGLSVAALRIAIQPFVSDAASQTIGSFVISIAAIASTVVMLRPPGRPATLWERILGFALPAIAAASAFNAFCWITDFSAPPTARYWWLLAAMTVGFIQLAAIITHAAERFRALRTEVDLSRDAHASVSQRYREVTEQASDMISEVSEHGTVLYANPAHEVILGFKPSELLGLSVAEVFDGQLVEDSGDSAFVDVLSMAPHLRLVVMTHRDGTQRTIESNIRPFIAESGERRLVVTSRDVTARVAAERALEEGREELETLVEERTIALATSIQALEHSQRLASIGTLAAGIAHQINNPIGSIQMASEFALQSEGGDEEREIWRHALLNGVDQAKRCGRIVSSVLQFARNEPITKSKEDLAAILRRICEQTLGYAQNQKSSIDTSGIEGPLPVLGSAIELEQAFLNILRNATESSREGVCVNVRAVRENDCARITISDNGEGMDDQDSLRAFDPFFTTKLGRGGTGLGLSVAHGVVTDHGGTLSIESKKHKGTTMTISIPLFEGSDSKESDPVHETLSAAI